MSYTEYKYEVLYDSVHWINPYYCQAWVESTILPEEK